MLFCGFSGLLCQSALSISTFGRKKEGREPSLPSEKRLALLAEVPVQQTLEGLAVAGSYAMKEEIT